MSIGSIKADTMAVISPSFMHQVGDA